MLERVLMPAKSEGVAPGRSAASEESDEQAALRMAQDWAVGMEQEHRDKKG